MGAEDILHRIEVAVDSMVNISSTNKWHIHQARASEVRRVKLEEVPTCHSSKAKQDQWANIQAHPTEALEVPH